MNILTKTVAGLSVIAAISLSGVSVAHAAVVPSENQPKLICAELDKEAGICDLNIKKTVSINGAALVDANTNDTAPTARVGDTITWKVSVGTGESVIGVYNFLKVADVLPGGLSVENVSMNVTGNFAENAWSFSFGPGDGVDAAELTIVTKATTAGYKTNTATLSEILEYCQNDQCAPIAYNDDNNANNSDSAVVNVVADEVVPPTVLSTNTTTPEAPQTLAVTGQSASSRIGLIALFVTSVSGIFWIIRRDRKAEASK